MKGQIKTEVTPSQGCGKAGASFIAFIFVFHQSNRRKKAGRMEQTGERQMWVFYYKRYLFPQSPSKLRIKMMKGNRGVSSRPAPRSKATQQGCSFSPEPRGHGPQWPRGRPFLSFGFQVPGGLGQCWACSQGLPVSASLAMWLLCVCVHVPFCS